MKAKQYDYSRKLNSSPRRRLIRKSDLMRDLGVSQSTLRRMIARGDLPPPLRTEHGYITGWFRDQLIEWFQRHN